MLFASPERGHVIVLLEHFWRQKLISLIRLLQDLPNGIGTILHAVNASSQSQQNGSVEPLSFPPEPQPAGPPKGAKPMGFSSFPKEPAPTPISWAKGQAEGNLDLLWWRVHETGGHFPALEQPEVLWEDVEEFVAQVWKGGCLGNGHA